MNSIIYTSKAICLYHEISPELLSDMVTCGIVRPSGKSIDKWFFSQKDYDRMAYASRFYKELKINISGAAIVLKLLEDLSAVRIEKLNSRITDRYFDL